MTNAITSPFVCVSPSLPLLNDYGRAFAGLEGSSSPELVERVKYFFDYLSERLGFLDTSEGKENQKKFNILLNAVYPEVLIDLADLVYAQHERPAVVLNFEHININLKKNFGQNYGPLKTINNNIGELFYQLARTIIENPSLRKDQKIIDLLGESYSYYLYQTENFPWEFPAQTRALKPYHPVLNVATGLVGFSMIKSWPDDFPKLVLSDNDPFILCGLAHYLKLTGRTNVILIEADFPEKPPQGIKFGSIVVNKFLHHLNRLERIEFLKWSLDVLEPNGVLEILDTDLEYHIFEQSKQPEFRNKLTFGYRETLVEIENNFTVTLKNDVEDVGFRITDFDCRGYHDETDAFSQNPDDKLILKFLGVEILAEKP